MLEKSFIGEGKAIKFTHFMQTSFNSCEMCDYSRISNKDLKFGTMPEALFQPFIHNGELVLEIECGSNVGWLFLSRLCQGSKGASILFQNVWFTPNEFQFISGRETAKDWKRSIRHKGRSLKLLMAKGFFNFHPSICACKNIHPEIVSYLLIIYLEIRDINMCPIAF